MANAQVVIELNKDEIDIVKQSATEAKIRAQFGEAVNDGVDDLVSYTASIVDEAVKYNPHAKFISLATKAGDFVWDVTTNQIANSGGNDDWRTWLRSTTTGVVAIGSETAVGIVTNKVPVVGPIISIGAGNAASSFWQDSIFDRYIGPGLYKFYHGDNKDESNFIGFQSPGNFINTILNHWDIDSTENNIETKIEEIDTIKTKEFYILTQDLTLFVKENGKNDISITFESTPTNRQFEELLRQFNKDFLPKINGEQLTHNFLHNSYNGNAITKEEINALVMNGDKAILHGILKLKPYVLERDKSEMEQINPNDYSDTYLEKRTNMFYTYVSNNHAVMREKYHDNEIPWKSNSSSINHVIFGSAQGETIPIEKNTKIQYVFADDGNDIVYASGIENYIEGGKGNDTLYSNGSPYEGHRSAKDTYYFAINDGSDTIIDSGGGHDTIYFGKGINKDDISARIDGDNLFISVDNKGTMIEIKNWHKDDNVIEYIKFEDDKNTILQKEDILSLIEKNKEINNKEKPDNSNNKEEKENPNNNTLNTEKSDKTILINTNESNLTNKFSLAEMIGQFCKEQAELAKEQNANTTTKDRSLER